MTSSPAPGSEGSANPEPVQPVANVSSVPTSETKSVQAEQAGVKIESTSANRSEIPGLVSSSPETESKSTAEADNQAQIAGLQEKIAQQRITEESHAKNSSLQSEPVVVDDARIEAGSPTSSELSGPLSSLQRARREALFARHGGGV